MNLNPVEWANAQMLLTKLAQVLATFAKPEGAESGFSFKERLFVPPLRKEGSRSFSRETRILTELQAAQKTMGDLIEQTPEEEPSALQGKEAPAKEKEGEKRAPVSFVRKEVASFGQAKILIVQVREAIQKLSSSSNLAEPEAVLLRKEIQRLKPLLDALVETVSREKPKETIARPLFRLALPLPQKKPLFSTFRFISLPETKATVKQPAILPQEASFSPKSKPQESPLLHSEPKTIGAAPLSPELKREPREKKKKKKSFWFRSDREDAEDSLP